MQLLKNNSPLRFVVIFLALFLLLYYFNIGFWGLVSPGKFYDQFLDNHLNYVAGLRWLLIQSSVAVLHLFGYIVIHNATSILVVGHHTIIVAYDCLGLGVMSFFSAFVIAYPKPLKTKLLFLILGNISIQILNISRLVLLVLFWNQHNRIDHHDIFNAFIYIVIAISLYFWIKAEPKQVNNAKN